MGKWREIKEWNKQRKKGLKNPTALWFWSLFATFLLTVLPSIFMSFLSKEDRSGLYDLDVWIKVAVDNLYPMMIAQSVVTMFQNFGIVSPPPQKDESEWSTPCFGWTIVLAFCLVLYVIGYPILILANPPRLNAFLFAISGILAVLGLISILQLDKEQERIQKKHQELRKARMLQGANRTLSGTIASDSLPDANVIPTDVGDGSHSKDSTPDTTTVK